jgi:uncharacterized protein
MSTANTSLAADGTPKLIEAFIKANHVVSLATVSNGIPWAASCYYAYDEKTKSLIVLTSDQTRHGAQMLENPTVAGTISSQPKSIMEVKGAQFSGTAELLKGGESDSAREIYCARHPAARMMKSQIWRVRLEMVKYTDNACFPDHKLLWHTDVGTSIRLRTESDGDR